MLREKLISEIVASFRQRLTDLINVCESEIEKLFLLNLIEFFEVESDDGTFLAINYDYPDIKVVDGRNVAVTPNNRKVVSTKRRFGMYVTGVTFYNGLMNFVVVPQETIIIGSITYRVDFLITISSNNEAENDLFICIECDGHEFHEKTKEQVERDKRRNRDLAANGYLVFRYSGSEIYNKSGYFKFREFVQQLFRAYFIHNNIISRDEHS